MRRRTLIWLIILLLMLTGAAVYQFKLAAEPQGPLPGPTSPGATP